VSVGNRDDPATSTKFIYVVCDVANMSKSAWPANLQHKECCICLEISRKENSRKLSFSGRLLRIRQVC
jgi:hypothetical protein